MLTIYLGTVLLILILLLFWHSAVAFEFHGMDLNQTYDLFVLVLWSFSLLLALYSILILSYSWIRYPHKRAT